MPGGVAAAEEINRFFTLGTAAAVAVVEAYEALLKTTRPADSAPLGRAILTFARKATFREQDTVAEKAAFLPVAVAKKIRDPELVKAGAELAGRVKDKAAGAASPLRHAPYRGRSAFWPEGDEPLRLRLQPGGVRLARVDEVDAVGDCGKHRVEAFADALRPPR